MATKKKRPTTSAGGAGRRVKKRPAVPAARHPMSQESYSDSDSGDNDIDPRVIMMQLKQQTAQKQKKNERRVQRYASDSLKRIARAAEECTASLDDHAELGTMAHEVLKAKKVLQKATHGKLGGNRTEGEARSSGLLARGRVSAVAGNGPDAGNGQYYDDSEEMVKKLMKGGKKLSLAQGDADKTLKQISKAQHTALVQITSVRSNVRPPAPPRCLPCGHPHQPTPPPHTHTHTRTPADSAVTATPAQLLSNGPHRAAV
eukprot:COSAG01_NODE_3239_length_6369_cov_4.207018_6_plen_259_part_00